MTYIDSHFHWYPPELLELMSEQETYPRVERVGDSFAEVYAEEGDGPSWAKGRPNWLTPIWLDLDEGLDASRQMHGDDVAVVGTTGVLSGLLGQVPSKSSLDCARTYNQAVARAQREYPGRFYGTATVPLHDASDAVEIADEAIKEFGLVGVNLPAMSETEFVDAPRLEPFFGRIEELGVPLIVHPTDVVFAESFPDYNGAMYLSIGRLLDSSVTMLRLILSGVLERHPALKILQTHAGALLPYQAGRLDKNARVADLPLPPSAYLKRVFVDTVSPLDLTIRTAVEFYGVDHVLYGTDYPCWIPEAARDVIDKAGLDEEARELVCAGNARSLFNIR